jgi:hypothetical protein
MQSLLSQVDRAQVDMLRITADLEASQVQCESLLVNKNALLHALEQMVPQAELQAERAARAALAAEMDRLSVLKGKMQQEIDSVNVRLQAAQNEVDRLLRDIQVVFCGLKKIFPPIKICLT